MFSHYACIHLLLKWCKEDNTPRNNNNTITHAFFRIYDHFICMLNYVKLISAQRLNNLTVRVDTDMDVNQVNKEKMKICHHYPGTVPANATVTLECEAVARYVMISMPIGPLTLCEVEVYAKNMTRKEKYFVY